jgi:hypothetical protein
MCKVIEPEEVMRFLNALYMKLDTLTDIYGVYKVEVGGSEPGRGVTSQASPAAVVLCAAPQTPRLTALCPFTFRRLSVSCIVTTDHW